MGEWITAFVFGLFLMAFTLGVSSLIMAFLPVKEGDAIRSQVEYGFFGVSGLVLSLVFVYALM
ncbi:hypothetical protein [Planctobacterium marinum]|uniref:Uncharacterized protein n=1 Tax=Planctobacterium marinum TaxID=1631968 RepID=A0AA48HYG8_9ALTE|nr:hypothetical protein MACH26_36940 [Planctobacterium marinum]